MIEKLAIWYLRKKNVSIIMNYRLNGGILKPKQKQSRMYDNTFIDTDHRYMDNTKCDVPEGNFEFTKQIQGGRRYEDERRMGVALERGVKRE